MPAFAYGRLHVREADGTLKAAPWLPIDDATAFTDGQRTATAYGFFAKSHIIDPVFIPFYHVSIRVVPRRQSSWLLGPTIYRHHFGKHPEILGDLEFLTLGAGPSPESLGACVVSVLHAGVNRTRDVTNPYDVLEPLPVSLVQEDQKIAELLVATEHYLLRQTEGAPDYECFPQSWTDGFNSNSWARGLLESTATPLPAFPFHRPNDYPGWPKPVPPPFFAPIP